MGSVPCTSIYMVQFWATPLLPSAGDTENCVSNRCICQTDFEKKVWCCFACTLYIYNRFSQRWKGRGEYGRNFVSRGKVGLISDDYKVLQRVPDALWKNYFHFHFHIRPGCPLRTRWRRWRRRRKRLVETTRNKRFPTLISCIFLSPAKKNMSRLFYSPLFLISLATWQTESDPQQQQPELMASVITSSCMGFPLNMAQKNWNSQNKILTGIYIFSSPGFRTSPWPWPSGWPWRGSWGVIIFFSLCLFFAGNRLLPECPDAVEQPVLAQLLRAHVHGHARAAAAEEA